LQLIDSANSRRAALAISPEKRIQERLGALNRERRLVRLTIATDGSDRSS
jgi:hypothetical protein